MAHTPTPFTPLPAIDLDRYRREVLAAVLARGGIDATDPWEAFVLPAEVESEPVIAARIDEISGLWQKDRDNPKYRALVTALLKQRDDWRQQLLDPGARGRLRAEVAAQRKRRRERRFEILDPVISGLLERHGRAIPPDKLTKLREVAAQYDLSDADLDGRITELARAGAGAGRGTGTPADPAGSPAPDPPSGPTVEPPAVAIDPVAGARQVRSLLEELHQLLPNEDEFSTLFELLGLRVDAPRAAVEEAVAALKGRNRERRADRSRATIDDLLALVDALVLRGDRDLYMDAVADEVRDRLRPEVAAAILLDDRLTPEARRRLLARAVDHFGLDERRATRLIDELSAGPPPEPPSRVVAQPGADGAVVTWTASPTPGVEYRIVAESTVGTTRILGRTTSCQIVDGLPAPGTVYLVVARRDGASSTPARSAEPTPTPTSAPPAEPAPTAAPTPPPTAPNEPDEPNVGPTAPGPQLAAPVTGVQAGADGRLRWRWPVGVTEALVCWRSDAAPDGPDDPAAQRKKVTNGLYETGDGWVLPVGTGPVHVAVFSGLRDGSTLHWNPACPDDARALVDPSLT